MKAAIKEMIARTCILLGSIFIIFSSFNFFPVNVVADAENMDSSQYRIDFGNVNFGSNNHSSSSYDLGSTIGQLAAQEFSSSGYTVKAGFQYIQSIIPFTFSISDISVDLGTLSPDTPSTATTDLTVSFGGAGSYQVTAEEIGPMQTSSGTSSIADTTCNGGAQTCSETAAEVWDSTTKYGFGYNMTGDDIPSDFVDGTYYRPFADSTAPENPEIVMLSNNVTLSSTATMTIKANVSNLQPAGTYNTIIRFTATPGY